MTPATLTDEQRAAAEFAESNSPGRAGARTTRPRCCGDNGGVTKAGTPCRSALNLSPVTGRCLMHDEARAEQRAVMRSRGGAAAKIARTKAKAADPVTVPGAPKTIEDAEKFASWLTHAVCVGDIDARTAHEAAVCLREFRGASEKRIMEREVKALRAKLAAATKRPRA